MDYTEMNEAEFKAAQFAADIFEKTITEMKLDGF